MTAVVLGLSQRAVTLSRPGGSGNAPADSSLLCEHTSPPLQERNPSPDGNIAALSAAALAVPAVAVTAAGFAGLPDGPDGQRDDRGQRGDDDDIS